jgi:hypothetical protein
MTPRRLERRKLLSAQTTGRDDLTPLEWIALAVHADPAGGDPPCRACGRRSRSYLVGLRMTAEVPREPGISLYVGFVWLLGVAAFANTPRAIDACVVHGGSCRVFECRSLAVERRRGAEQLLGASGCSPSSWTGGMHARLAAAAGRRRRRVASLHRLDLVR